MGISSGANTLAALRLRDEGARAATLWPDCADRYVSVGLESPASRQVHCPLQQSCEQRARRMLGEAVDLAPEHAGVRNLPAVTNGERGRENPQVRHPLLRF